MARRRAAAHINGAMRERFWRTMSVFWTFFAIAVYLYDYLTPDEHSVMNAAVGTIYVAILSIFVSTKEFDRWYDRRHGRHHGEIFIYLWTAFMIVLIGVGLVPGSHYRIPSETTTVYIVVMSIYAITQRSSELHRRRLAKR